MGDDNTTTSEEMVTATAPSEFLNESSTKGQQGVVTQVVGDSETDHVLPSTNGTDNSTNDSELSEAGDGIKGAVDVEKDLEQPQVDAGAASSLPEEEPVTTKVETESTGVVAEPVVVEPKVEEATLEPAAEPVAEPEPTVETIPQAAPEPTIESTVVVPTITETTAVTPTITEVAVSSPVPPTEPVFQPEAIHALPEQVQATVEPVVEAQVLQVKSEPTVESVPEVAQALPEQISEPKVEHTQAAEVASPVVPATSLIVDPVPTTTTISAEPIVKEEPAVAVQLEPGVPAEPVKEEAVKVEPSHPVAVPVVTMAPEQVLMSAPVMPPMAAAPEPVVVATSTTPIAVVAPTVKFVESAPTTAITTNPLPVSVVPVITSTMKQNGNSGTQPTAKKTTPKPKNNVKPNNANVTPTPGSATTTPKKKSKKKQPEPEPVIDEVKKRRKTWTPEEQKYACKQCNFRSAYASSLGRHVQMSHKDNVSIKDESSCGSTSSSTPAPVVTPTQASNQTPAPTPHHVPASPVVSSISMTSAAPTTILTIPKTELPSTTNIVHQQQPKAEEVNFRHVQILQPQEQHLSYVYHPVVSSTYQDVVNNPPIYNTSIRYDTADGIPITLIDPSTHQMNYNESEFLPFHKTEDDLGTIRSQPTMLNTLGSIAVPVSDIINLPPQSTSLTPLTSADNSIDTVASGLTPDARKRPLVTAVKSKPEDVVAKKRKKEGEGPTFSNVLVSTPMSHAVPSNQPGSTPTPKKKKKKPAGNNQGGPGANATPIKTAPPTFANSSTPSAKGKADKNGDETPGKKKKSKKPSDKPSNPCLITSTSSTCPICSFSTKYQFNLARHFQATHKEELQKVLSGAVSYPGIRKREMKEKSTKPKPKSKEKKAKQPGGNDQSSQSSQYSSSQNNSSQLSVAQEFEQFVRDENLEMFAEADNLDLSEPMVSSFIESLFSTDMGAAEGWNNVGNHQVVLNPSVHQQTIGTTAYIQHPVQPGTQMQAVSQGGYVTTVDLLPHQTQAQVVGGYITQPQQLYEFQKAPHSNPIQANVVINGVTTTMDLNSVIEKNTSQLHSQPPENSSHQSHSKVFIAQSSESHTTAVTAGVALDHSSQHYQGQQQNGFTGHLHQHLSSTDQHHPSKWANPPQQQQQVIISSSVQNSQHQWSQSQVYAQQPQQYPPPASNNPPPATVQYHTPAGTIISHPIEAPPFAQWQSQPQVHQSHPAQSTIQISAESRSLSTVDTSFLHSSLTDNSHNQLSSVSHGSVIESAGPSPLVTISKNPNSISTPPTGNSAEKRPTPKKKKKANAAPPPIITPPPPTSGKKKTDVDSLSPEEREKRERYLQKRRERWKVSQERKKQLKNAQNVDGGSNADIGTHSSSLTSSVPVNQHSHHVPPHASLPHVSSHLSHPSSKFLRLDEPFLQLPPSRPVCSVTSAIKSPIFSVPSDQLGVANTNCINPYLPPVHIPPTVTKKQGYSIVSPIKQLTLSAVLGLAKGDTKQKKQVTFSTPEVKLSREDARKEYLRNYNKNRPPRKKKTTSETNNDFGSATSKMPPKRGKKKDVNAAVERKVLESAQKSQNDPAMPLSQRKKALKSAMASETLASPQQSQNTLSIASLSISSPSVRGAGDKVQKPKKKATAEVSGTALACTTPVPVTSAANQGNVDLKRSVRGTPLKKFFPDKTPEEIQAIKKERQAQFAKERREALQQRRRDFMESAEIDSLPAPSPKTITPTGLEHAEQYSLLPNVAQKCSFPDCNFVANNIFELEFHENIHRTAESLPPFLAGILESSGKLPQALSLRPSIDSMFGPCGVAAEAISQEKADDNTKLSSPSTLGVEADLKTPVR